MISPTSLPLTSIQRNPGQPRETFAAAALQELADSIRSVGILSPIVVRPIPSMKGAPGHYQVVAGERRWRAAQMVGLDRIPVVIREDVDDGAAFELAMIENVVRQDMDPMEEARGYQRLLDSGLTVETMSERIGKSPSAIRARLKLLDLHPIASELVAKGHLDAWTAGHIARLGFESQHKVLRAMREGLLPKGDMNAVERLCTALQAQDQQVSLMGDSLLSGGTFTELASVPKPDPTRQAARELDVQIDSTLRHLERLAELLEAGIQPGSSPTELGDIAVRVSKLAARVTKTLNTQAAEKLAADLGKDVQ